MEGPHTYDWYPRRCHWTPPLLVLREGGQRQERVESQAVLDIHVERHHEVVLEVGPHLWKMVDNPETDSLIGWSEDGNSFLIRFNTKMVDLLT